ncbi:MAG: RluA family pseudouridine synthase [Cyclobacteriaceae bacterium]|nr:RluA family pseudouridine synthase [Cyclobacteriaceae bacterium]
MAISKPEIIYEDNHLLVLNKPAGMLVQSDDTGDMSLELWGRKYIREKYNKPGEAFLEAVHRIDRPVSGLVILARTSKALERMHLQFKEREIKKLYWALIVNRPEEEEGTLIHWIKKYRDRNIVQAFNETVKEGQYAELSYKTIGRIGNDYLLEVKPVTGRPHQIRAQLSKMGCPIKGDVKYGARPEKNKKLIYLHARSITFTHPVKKENMLLRANLPSDDNWNKFKSF